MALVDYANEGQSGQSGDSPGGGAWNDFPTKTFDQMRGSVNSLYQSALGRALRPDEEHYWLKQIPGNVPGHENDWGFTASNWEDQIRNSQEAQNYRATQAAGGGGGAAGASQWAGNFNAFGQAWLGSGGRTVADLQRFIAGHPEYGAQMGGSKGDKVTIGGRTFDAVLSAGAGGLGATWNDITNGEGGGGGSQDSSTAYGNSPSTELYLNEILSRLDALRHPADDPFMPLLQALALKQVDTLGQAPYTQGEEAALVAQYREPLTQARDAQLQMNKERIGARGMLPTSGLLDVLNQQTASDYTQGIAKGSNDLAVRAVAQKQTNADKALAILASLVSTEKGRRDEINKQSQDLVETAALLPGMDERRLKLLLDAAGSGQNIDSSLNQLLQLVTLGQRTDFANAADSDATKAAIGQAIARLMENLGKN